MKIKLIKRYRKMYSIFKKGISLAAALAIMLTSAAAVFAEGVNTEFTGQAVGYASVLYDNTNGLPTSEANVICQTKNGFIWIGSYSGLIRYDGSTFELFDASLGVSSVVSLYEDSRGRLWIGTNDNGVAFYDNGSFTFYGKVEGLKSSSIRAIEEDKDGNILIATTLGMAYVDTDDKLHILDDPQLNNEYICELQRGADGVIYGETISGAVFGIENMRVTAFYSGADLGIGVISCITPDLNNDGYVYLGTEKSEIIYANMRGGMSERTTISVAPHVNVNYIERVQDKIWVCTNSGIGYINENNEYNALGDIPLNNSVCDMLADHEGNLWFTSSRQGVMKIVPCRFTDINKAASLGNFVANTTCFYSGDLYIGTDTGLHIIDSGYNEKTNALTEMVGSARVRCIKTDSKGNLWVCTYSPLGLVCCKNDGTIATYNESTGFKSNRVRTVTELSDGTMLVSTSGGLHFLRDGEMVDALGSSAGLTNTEILTMCEGAGGTLYLGSDGDGLYKVDGKNVTRMGLEDGLGSEVILRIKKDEKTGTYWIITSNSIAYMKDDKITTIKNFPYSNNFDIFFDTSGGAWILSSNGIYITGVEQLIKDEKPEYILFDTSCGLPSIPTANARSCISEDGTLYIAGTTGVSSVNINDAQAEDDDIILTVPFVSADDNVISPREDGSFVIPADAKRITIYGYAITYSLNNPIISYRLDGFDDEPREVMKKNMQPVTYTNLGGGEYTFRLSTINTLTGEADNTIDVKIKKVRALYEHWLFWLAVAIIVIGGILVGIRLYLNKKTAELEAREKRKQEFIDEMIEAFAMCIDLKDTYTNGHSFRVAEYSKLLAEKLGYSEEDVKEIHNIALLHDIGKLGIPDEVLNKPGRPTDEEYEILKTHPAKGEEILKKISISPDLAIGAGYHHERPDGRGYANGLKGDEIPYVAQIIAVADTFDAMYSTRPYRKQMDIKDVRDEMKRVSGTQLNGEIVEKMAELIDEGAIDKVKNIKANNDDNK